MVHVKRLREKHPKESIKVSLPLRKYILDLTSSSQAIFLVGGFGQSAFLREAIASAHSDIQVIQPDDAKVIPFCTP